MRYGHQSRTANTNNYNLVINGILLEHAGIYECQGYDEENHQFLSRGELFVTGKLFFLLICLVQMKQFEIKPLHFIIDISVIIC